MKKLIPAIVLFAVLATSVVSKAQNPTYSLTLDNAVFTSDSLVFDVHIKHTNPGAVSQFQYALGQYFLTFNTAIANGSGSYTYRIIGSDLPENQRPRNPSVAGNTLRLAVNTAVGAGNGYIISSTGNGTLVVKMSLKHSSGLNINNALNLAWVNPGGGQFWTKVFAYVNNVSTELTNAGSHSVVSVNQIASVIPEKYEIYQNYPNPFNPSTKIRFDLPQTSEVVLSVFDISGREVSRLFTGKLQAGSFEFKWDASDLSSGAYFYRIQAGSFSRTMKMMLVK